MKKFAFALLIVALVFGSFVMSKDLFASSKGHGAHWGYEGDSGPEHWGDLSPDFSLCKEGKSQTPIDITGAAKAELEALDYDYKDSSLRVINNGHAIQANYDEGSILTIEGKKFDLLQFHFHTPSENIVDGKPYDMEAHLVHKAADGQLAVIAVFMKKGAKNDFIQTIWDNLPAEEGKENTVDDIKINANNLMPDDKTFFRFSGSLTTPPCSEGVIWSALKTPVEVSEDQVSTFAKIFPMNARPVQPLNDRVIKVSN